MLELNILDSFTCDCQLNLQAKILCWLHNLIFLITFKQNHNFTVTLTKDNPVSLNLQIINELKVCFPNLNQSALLPKNDHRLDRNLCMPTYHPAVSFNHTNMTLKTELSVTKALIICSNVHKQSFTVKLRCLSDKTILDFSNVYTKESHLLTQDPPL